MEARGKEKINTAIPLQERLVAAMKDIGYLQKDGKNKDQRYNFLSERKVKEECQKAFIKQGLAPRWTVRVVHRDRCDYNGKNGFDAIVHVTLTLESALGTLWETEGVGQGRDPGDKAVMKAQTAAIRECLKSLFLIASGDDPESMDPEGGKSGGAVRTAVKPKDVAKSLLDKIKRLTTIDEYTTMIPELEACGLPKNTAEFQQLLTAAKAKKAELQKGKK